MLLSRHPKIELHCHLDASVRVDTAREIAGEMGLGLPEPLERTLVAPDVCLDLADYIGRLDTALAVMQRPGDLKRIAAEYVEDLASDGVIYGEVRFAPQLHTRRGLSLREVLDSVHGGLQEGSRRTGVRVGLILCCLRHEPPARSLEIARLAVSNADKVCAIDLAADEARFPGAPHAGAFALAREAGLSRTVHAGEAARADSIREAIGVLGAQRIGHGVAIVEQQGLVDEFAERSIALEMCPTSNVQTRAVASLVEHPISVLIERGLCVTVSTDGRTLSGTTVTKEFERLSRNAGWGMREFWQCQKNAAGAVFAPDSVRRELLAKIEAAESAS